MNRFPSKISIDPAAAGSGRVNPQLRTGLGMLFWLSFPQLCLADLEQVKHFSAADGSWRMRRQTQKVYKQLIQTSTRE